MATNHDHDHERDEKAAAKHEHDLAAKHDKAAVALADAPVITPLVVTLATGLAANVGATDRTIKLLSGTGAAVGMTVKMENEWTTVTGIAADGVTLTLGVRGINGSFATTHKAGAPVQVGNNTDFTATAPPGSATTIPLTADPIFYYAAPGAIAIPPQDAIIFLNSATVDAMTLATPGTDIDGRKLTIQAATAKAYTITTTALGFKNTASTATFGGAIGDTLTIVACKGQWNPVATVNATLA